jgi:hypothetical protein
MHLLAGNDLYLPAPLPVAIPLLAALLCFWGVRCDVVTCAHYVTGFNPSSSAAAACSQAHVKSKKYQELVRASGEPAPAPIIMMKQQQQPADGDSAPAANGECCMQVLRRAQQP